MVTLSPVGLAAAPVANQVSFLATFKEKLCRCVCATSTNQPFATVTYRNETPVLNGTTVFVPIVATTTITTPNACKCQAETQVINEQVLASASKAQNIIDKAPSLLAELNPMYKEKQETEQRFGKIEGSIGEMKELMKKQQEMMENFIKKFES